MAALNEQDRVLVFGRLMAALSQGRTSVTLTKPQLHAAVDAADAWIDGNAASFNSALPAAARASLTAQQKAQLLTYVALRRFEV